MFLVENLSMDWSTLTADDGLLSSGDAQLIQAEQSLQARNYLLLKLLAGKPKDTFDAFIEIVRRQQTHIYILLVTGVEGTIDSVATRIIVEK